MPGLRPHLTLTHRRCQSDVTAGSYVALTLLGRPSGQQMSSTPIQAGSMPTQASSVTSQLPPPYPSHDGSPVNIVLPSSTGRGDDRSPLSGHSSGPRGEERTPISGPTAVDKLAEELKNSSGSVSSQVQNKLDEKRRVCERLGDQLYLLTGIPTESHISSPKSPPSGLPPPGGTLVSPPGCQRPPLKRYSSGDGLNNIQENKENVHIVENPAPWLPGGPKHRKAESMPESVLSDDFSLDNSKEATVSRSNSDSDKRSKHHLSEDLRDAGNAASADEIEKLTTSSLPSSVYETTNNSDTPVSQSSMGMTSPSQQPREIWEESTDMSYSSELQESLNTTKGSGGSFSPPRELGGRILHVVSPLQADIIPMEEEEEVNIEDDHLEDHGPFSDLNQLKHKPAHLAVFLHYLISNSDPSPLLFYLVTEHYPQGSIKELRRWAYEIYSTFLVPTAVIKVEDIDSSLLDNIEQTLLHRSDKEDAMRTIFQTVRHMAQKQIFELLADFRQKRTLGLANLYGDNELSENMDRAAELKTVENKLLKHLITFTLLRMPVCYVCLSVTYASLLYCDINAHKACMDQMQDHCSGRRKKEKRTSMLNMLRKTTNPNPAAIKEAQRLHDETSHVNLGQVTSGHMTPPGSTSGVFQIRPGPKDEEEEDLESLRAGNKVSSLVEQYSQLQHTVLVDDAKSPTTPPRGRSPETMETYEQKHRSIASINLSRSESLNKKKPEARHNVRRTRSDLQVDDQTLKSLNQSGSSSNSSLSNRSLDSPSTSAEALSDAHHMASNLTALQDDSDVEVEPELPPLEASIPKEILKKLRKSEKKRQDVINELFYTERTHVRDLKIMQRLFCNPMMNLFSDPELVTTLFPGLDDLIEVHRKLNNKFKNAKKESPVVPKVAELMLSSWEGEEGEEFKKSCAKFCRDQSHALAYLRMRQRKDQKLANFLQNFDLRQYKLIHDGLLTWRITKQKQIQMHVLLLDELLVLLQKQDDRLILKYHSTARDDNNKSTHSPIISLKNLMVRPVATDKNSMFLISDGEFGPQIYELQSRSTEAIKR
ncbi:hypothetical protein LSH36_51g06003 [Paralvinella palmiformis]|uniref:Rho guanine nucleotide exchange factor 11 n=1 Tax=Paralvinella palmiformis TaxID=53620 RepID=A0AAD9NEJ9_9ANNE|nr:hypothetical protein LSH36_51g06003 [Paralvinella palmiformis]